MYKIIKRTFDYLLSIFSIILFSTVLMILTLIGLGSNNQVFFVQKRPGLNGKTFKMIKFRTMNSKVDLNGELLGDKHRLTKYGKFLRKTSFDELPELINVLKGDMSLVGPRPLLVQYLPLYSAEQARRHIVRPGITGWAQVNGRNAISWDDKFKLDVWYVDNQSFWLDIKILLLTVKKVFVREGISADGHVTIEPFKGSKHD